MIRFGLILNRTTPFDHHIDHQGDGCDARGEGNGTGDGEKNERCMLGGRHGRSGYALQAIFHVGNTGSNPTAPANATIPQMRSGC
jgi:hypothetical protein